MSRHIQSWVAVAGWCCFWTQYQLSKLLYCL